MQYEAFYRNAFEEQAESDRVAELQEVDEDNTDYEQGMSFETWSPSGRGPQFERVSIHFKPPPNCVSFYPMVVASNLER